MKNLLLLGICVACALGTASIILASPKTETSKTEMSKAEAYKTLLNSEIDENDFLNLFIPNPVSGKVILEKISNKWEPGFLPMLIEVLYFSRDQRLNQKLYQLIEQKTGVKNTYDLNQLYDWLWSQEIKPPDFYSKFKAKLYYDIDPRFKEYFEPKSDSTIRLDEIRWGGVQQNGIPPLRNPKMLKMAEADYLADSDVVFGLEINGDYRAYPKRILAWHEMFIDTVGGLSVTGAYCTLCGSMILYDNKLGDKSYKLGTSGFLFRSNKLMFDEDSNSLWNTLWGEPVLGSLVGKGIKLKKLPVSTTTWGQWKKLNPGTTVLSLDTGVKRDYSEGAAYREYFATDEVMFTVPKLDKRLKNKNEILALQSTSPKDPPVAISSDFLRTKPIYKVSIGSQNYLVLTDKSGAHRVYEDNGLEFTNWDQESQLQDSTGEKWKMEESQLKSSSGKTLLRVPAHNAFWFGWYAAYPNTKLIK